MVPLCRGPGLGHSQLNMVVHEGFRLGTGGPGYLTGPTFWFNGLSGFPDRIDLTISRTLMTIVI